MYLKRALKPVVDHALNGFPAVLITGPRQSGKTTFLRTEYGDRFRYVSFDDPLNRQFAHQDPNGFLDSLSADPVILDEVQYVPELFSYLKLRIDADRQVNGRFLMTGSQQFQLMKNISDSLAGRIAILELPPFHFLETRKDFNRSLQETVWLGGYPNTVLNPDLHDLWISSYIQTYVERDIRQLRQIRDIGQFEQFLTLIASCHGQELNLAGLSRSTGLSIPGCKQWIGLLQASYLIVLLQPFFQNFKKRLIKAPKLFFWDSAIAAWLTKHQSPESLWHGAMGGAFFEGFIITEVMKILISKGERPDLYFWRSHDGMEIDLILRRKGKFIPIEIKKTATPMPGHATRIQIFNKLAGELAEPGLIVCNVNDEVRLPGGVRAKPWHEFLGWV